MPDYPNTHKFWTETIIRHLLPERGQRLNPRKSGLRYHGKGGDNFALVQEMCSADFHLYLKHAQCVLLQEIFLGKERKCDAASLCGIACNILFSTLDFLLLFFLWLQEGIGPKRCSKLGHGSVAHSTWTNHHSTWTSSSSWPTACNWQISNLHNLFP